MLHDRLTDPIDAGIVTDGLVEWVNQDNFKPLVPGILGDPIGIQYSQASQLAACSLLCNTAQIPRALVLVDTLVARLTINDSLGNTCLTIASLDPDTVVHVPLLCLVS